jgi:hypothetical protein
MALGIQRLRERSQPRKSAIRGNELLFLPPARPRTAIPGLEPSFIRTVIASLIRLANCLLPFR